MKDIEDYEGLYAITSCGKVWSYRRKKFLKPYDNGYGYSSVVLTKDGVKKHYKVHRLVAQAYIPNPENKPEVNHIDEVRNHNWIGNLEWVTSAENKHHSSPRGKPKVFSKIRCVETGVIYKSCADAERQTGIHRYNINCVVNGRFHTAGGYHWERAATEDKNEVEKSNMDV